MNSSLIESVHKRAQTSVYADDYAPWYFVGLKRSTDKITLSLLHVV